MHAAPRQPILGKGGNRRLQQSEHFAKTPQQIVGEPRPYLPGIHELSTAVVTQQQRSEPAAAPSWIGVTANDELLFSLALEFEPIARSPGHVHTLRVLCDDTFPSRPTRLSVVILAFSRAMFREPQGVMEVKGLAKYLLSVPERNPPDVVTVQVEQVEQIEPYRHLANQFSRRTLHLHASLQLCETGDQAVDRDTLAIRNKASGCMLMHRLDHCALSS